MTPIYLDHHASTPVRPEVRESMAAVSAFGNPASAHSAGRKARQVLDQAREQIAELLAAQPDEVIFTSGATEGNNLAIFGLAGNRSGEILVSRLEHPSVIEPVLQLEKCGFSLNWLPVNTRGVVEQLTVRSQLTDPTELIILMLANHETGAIQPVRHVVKTLPREIPLHCDAAQAVGKIPVRFRDLGVTTLTASAHKFGGPKGIGILLVKKGTQLAPRTFGGHQQRGLRPGTEPVPLAVGLATALQIALRDMTAEHVRLNALRTTFLNELCANIAPVHVNGPQPGDGDSLPTVLNLAFPGCRADVLLMALDLAGLACSTGSACSSGSLLPSPVIQALGVPDEILRSSIRFSFGWSTTENEVIQSAQLVTEAVRKLRSQSE